MAVPLRKSAEVLSISAPKKRANFATIDERIAKAVASETEDEVASVITANIIAYDKEAGNGKMRIEGKAKYMNFNVPVIVRAELRTISLQQ